MRWPQFALAFVAGIALAVGTHLFTRSNLSNAPREYRNEPTPTHSAQVASERETAIVRAVRKVSHAVVSIAVRRPNPTASVRGPFAPFLLEDVMSRLFPNVRERSEWELGSGLVVDEAGHIVTNAHVIEGAVDLYIVLADGRSFPQSKITPVGHDVEFDIAVLKVDAEEVGMLAAPIGDPTDLVVGEWLIAIGNPYGFYLSNPRQPSVSVGVVSALNREVRSRTRAIYKNMIQTDAAINPGNSGGALANASGEVVGINSFILTTDGGSVGLGFALPMDIVLDVVSDLVQYGEVQRPYAGLVEVDNMTPRLANSLGIPTRQGVIVLGVAPDSPAARAGIAPFDVIVSINAQPVADYQAADRAIFGLRIGDTITLRVERMGAPMTFSFPLEAEPKSSPEGPRS